MTTETKSPVMDHVIDEAPDIDYPPDEGMPYVMPGVNATTLADLKEATPKNEIKQRVAYGKNGAIHNPDGTPKMLDYVDARFVQERLDSVVGPENWQTHYEDTPNGVRCTISIYVQGHGWVQKTDVGIPSNIEPVKGAHSDAFKRAAVQWGIARDLYGEREEDDDGGPMPTVREQASGNGRTERYEQSQQQPPQQQEEGAPSGPPPECPTHGPMEYRSGYNKVKRKAWKAYFCTVRDCPDQPPIWL